MLTKRAVIVILAGVNLLLLAALWITSHSLPTAYGQTGGRVGDFVCVTAKAAGQTYDVLYLLDLPERKLYAFYPTGARRGQLTASPPRDLWKDFNR